MLNKIIIGISIIFVLLAILYYILFNILGSTFVFTPWGSIYVHALDCENTGLTHQHAKANKRYTKIAGVNHYLDEVEQISSQFLRIDGRLYDAYVAEFQRMNIEKTHNIENDINEKEFRVTDEEEQYFSDGRNYYFHKSYPAFKACFPGNNKNLLFPAISNMEVDTDVKTESVLLSEFQLDSPSESKFYLSQENNIFIKDKWGEGSDGYTPFAELNDKLFFKSDTGKFIEVKDANPATVRELGQTYSGHFFTDGELIIFQGEVIDFDLDSFKQIRAGHMYTHYFEIGDDIYHLHIPTNARYFGATLTKTDIDAETFVAIDTTGSFSGIVYKDKDYTYELKYRNTEYKEVIKTPHILTVEYQSERILAPNQANTITEADDIKDESTNTINLRIENAEVSLGDIISVSWDIEKIPIEARGIGLHIVRPDRDYISGTGVAGDDPFLGSIEMQRLPEEQFFGFVENGDYYIQALVTDTENPNGNILVVAKSNTFKIKE